MVRTDMDMDSSFIPRMCRRRVPSIRILMAMAMVMGMFEWKKKKEESSRGSLGCISLPLSVLGAFGCALQYVQVCVCVCVCVDVSVCVWMDGVFGIVFFVW